MLVPEQVVLAVATSQRVPGAIMGLEGQAEGVGDVTADEEGTSTDELAGITEDATMLELMDAEPIKWPSPEQGTSQTAVSAC